MINPLYNISDWTQQSNITQDNDTFKYNSPSLFFATGSPSYIIKDLGRHHNESLTFYLRSDDLVNSSFFVLFARTIPVIINKSNKVFFIKSP